jgi:hypothetical protein
MFKVNNINDLELLYSILREKYPNNQIEITFNYNTKQYLINVTSKPYKNDPEVPVDVNIEIVYGDSVTGDTPLLLRDKLTKVVTIKTIENICNENTWIEYPEFKLFDTTTIRNNKQYSLTNYEVWSDSGWNPILKVIRHKTNKKIYRISTNTGCVDVTEDHSLCGKNFEKIKPNKIGDIELLHSYPDKFNNFKTFNEIKIDNTDIADIDKILINNYSEYLLNCSKDVKEKFCKLLYKKTFFSFTSKLESAIIYYILRNLGYDINITFIDDRFNLQLRTNDPFKQHKVKKIKFLRDSNNQEFVYDLETANGRFQAGIGQLIVYNTDSIFAKIKFNRDDFEKNRIDTFKLAELCGEKLTNEIFDRPPIVLEFEKVFHPFILLTKKRYIANKFENMNDPFNLKGIDAKGIALTRRDYCKMVKNCYQDIINTILNDKASTGENKKTEDSIKHSTELYKRFINDIYNYNIDFDDLVISAMLAKEYSCKLCKKKSEWILKCEKCKTPNPQKLDICQKCKTHINCIHVFSLAHINLAQELLKRNEEISVGDRIAYLFVETANAKAQKNELAEDPKYAIQNNLKFNRSCYLEQLAKPILGFYKIVLKDRKELLDEIINYTNDKLEKCGAKPLKPSDFKIEE